MSSPLRCIKIVRCLSCSLTVTGIIILCVGLDTYAGNQSSNSVERSEYVDSALQTPWPELSPPNITLTQGARALGLLKEQVDEVMPYSGQSVAPVATRLLRAAVYPWDTAEGAPLTLSVLLPNSTAFSDSLTLQIPFVRDFSDPAFCGQTSCASSCGVLPRCTAASLNASCRASRNDAARFVPSAGFSGECSDGERCGNCEYSAVLVTVCLTIAPYGTIVGPEQSLFRFTGQSCYFPFASLDDGGPQRYSAGLYPSAGTISSGLFSVSVLVRSASDAYVMLQKATRGKGYFGTHRDSGAAVLIGVGIGLLVASCLAQWCGRTIARNHLLESAVIDEHGGPIPMAKFADFSIDTRPQPEAPTSIWPTNPPAPGSP